MSADQDARSLVGETLSVVSSKRSGFYQRVVVRSHDAKATWPGSDHNGASVVEYTTNKDGTERWGIVGIENGEARIVGSKFLDLRNEHETGGRIVHPPLNWYYLPTKI